MRGISHACLFDSDSNVKKIITFPNARKPKEYVFHKSFHDESPPYEETMRSADPPEVESDLEPMPLPLPAADTVRVIKTVEIMPPPGVEDIEEALGIVLPPGVEDIEEPLEITPPPEVEHLVKAEIPGNRG